MDLGKRAERGGQRERGDGTTVLAEPGWIVMVLCVVGGAGIGWLIPRLAHWLLALPRAPLEGPAELLTSIPEPGLSIGATVVGALLGLVVGFIAMHESLSVSVSDSGVVLNIRDADQQFPCDEIVLAVRDGRQLLLLGENGAELARENCGLPWPRLASAFTAHGYGWADEDPHRNEFRRWVPGAAGLPEGANAVLAARAEALKTKDDGSDARELRAELVGLGVFVRDENRRQYWRMGRRS